MPSLHRRRRMLLATVVLAACLSGRVARGADGAAAEVAELRAAFDETVSAALEPLNRKYAAALRRLESELAVARDYEAAIAVRDERLAVEAVLAANSNDAGDEGNAVDAPADDPATIVLAAEAATADAGVNNGDGALRFFASGQQAVWTLDAPTASGYDVVVTYACAAPATFRVKEHFFRLTCEAMATGGAGKFESVSFGTLKVTMPATSITLTIESIDADAPLLVRDLRMVPTRG